MNRLLILLIIITVFVLFSTPTQAGTYSGGAGTEANPYQISTVADWQELISASADWEKHFILLNDIDLAGVTLTPIGDSSIYFTGVFDGASHILHNVAINQPKNDFVGLFGYVGSGGQVWNLGLEKCEIIGKSRTASLVGRNEGIITTCYATGSIIGRSDVGGLVGRNLGTIRSSYTTCAVTGSGNSSGGLVGQVEDGTISGCYATGTVSGAGTEIGGLIGYSEQGTIEDCFSTGTLIFSNNSLYIGGLIGRNTGPVNRCFWDMETSGQTASEGGKGLIDSQMKSITLFQQFGWAGKGWIIQDGIDYPHRDWENIAGTPIPEAGVVPLAGNGTEAEPYQIYTSSDFALLSWHWSVLNSSIILMNDLNLNDIEIDPIGDMGSFCGKFDGQGHVLRNAGIRHVGSKYVGIFGRTGQSGKIHDVGVENVYMEGGYCVGGLVGDNDGSIINCYTLGTVKGQENVGGLVGDMDIGEICDCYATVIVTGNEDVGGLVGQIDSGSIGRCYTSGSVTGVESIGGLVGQVDNGKIYDCYATGEVHGKNCYIGGLAGRNSGTITSSYATGIVKDGSSVGGLVGFNNGSITACYTSASVSGTCDVGGLVGDNNSTITSSYTTGVVSGMGDTIRVGGLVGKNHASITTSYSTAIVQGIGNYIGGLVGTNNGKITSSYTQGTIYGIGDYIGGLVGENRSTIVTCYTAGTVVDIGDYVGGFCGTNAGTISLCFWDMETSGLTVSAGGEAKTTAQMQTPSTFIDAGWDFTDRDGDPSEWWMPSSSYPWLCWGFIYGGGSGTAEDPYQIWTPEQMNTIGYNPDNWAGHFKLMADIDMSGYTETQYKVIGNSTIPFTGIFDGDGHIIANLTYTTITPVYNIGLFGYINKATIKNIALENFTVTTDGNHIGGLVGCNDTGTITSCHAVGSINGNNYVGGLVGKNDSGTIISCYTDGTASATAIVGGLVGENSSGIITSCYATGSVSCSFSVAGGLSGRNNSGTINLCYATGSIYGGSSIGGLVGEGGGTIICSYATGPVSGPGCNYVGGLMGASWCTITACYATGSVSGDYSVGGLVGNNYNGTITSCYATGSVGSIDQSSSEVGGLVGSNQSGTINSCYASGAVSGFYGVGGLIGHNQGTLTACFWDIQTSGQTVSDGGQGKMTIEMQTQSTFTNAGWDFIESDGDTADWWMPVNHYPRLSWDHPYGGGNGTITNPYQIWTSEQMIALETDINNWDNYFILMADLDLSGLEFIPIANWITPFTGTFDGNGHILRNIVINRPDMDFVGLFSYLDFGGEIKNLGIENININGRYDVGGLVGYINSGSITACHIIGSISGSSVVGGLVGFSYYDCSITSSYTVVLVNGSNDVGGLVAHSYGPIIDCHASGIISGSEYVGGLVGWNLGPIMNSYAGSSVIATDHSVGGLVGLNEATLIACYSTGSVSGSTCVGGLVGGHVGTINSCYATGSVSGLSIVGGLVGCNVYSSITMSYATGAVTGSDWIGGLVGTTDSATAPPIACFWDVQSSGLTDGVGNENPDPGDVKGKTTPEMKTLATFTSAGWDFATTWAICEGTNYPRFLWQIPAGDFVCPDGVNTEDLNYYVGHWLMSNCTIDNNYCDGVDLNKSGVVDLADWSIFAENWMSE